MDEAGRCGHFQVTGDGHRGIGHSGVGTSAIGHRVSGSGVQVRVSGDALGRAAIAIAAVRAEVGSELRADLAASGRVERPRSTAADRGGQPYLDIPRTARGAVPTLVIGASASRPSAGKATTSGVHFIYLDESGDPGLINSPTKHYILAGLSVHHTDWHRVDERLRGFRQWAMDVYGLDPRHEIHAAEFLGAANMHCGLRREQRLLVIRRLVGVLSESPELRFFGWIADKESSDPLQRTGNRCIMDLKEWLSTGDFNLSNHLFIIHDQMHQTLSLIHI